MSRGLNDMRGIVPTRGLKIVALCYKIDLKPDINLEDVEKELSSFKIETFNNYMLLLPHLRGH